MSRAIAILTAVILLAGCAQKGGAAEPAQVPHGYVEGAEETAEPQLRLVLSDGETGQAHVLDPVTGRTTKLPTAKVRAIEGSGRYAFLTTAQGALQVIDSGGWTVDHGDHVHYYRAPARDLGTITGRPPYEVSGDAAIIAVRSGDGTVTLLDRTRLDRGERAETGRLTADAVVPYGERLLVAQDGAVQVRARTGEPGSEVGTCADPAGTAVTRRGAVLGCADGALLVTERNGTFESEKIRYPHGTTEAGRARAFRHRPGSSTLAAKAGDHGVWVLDVTAGTWRLLRTGPVLAVNATGDDTPILSLTRDGVLRAHDPRTGKQTARTKLLTAPAATAAIHVDTARAYVNDPAAKAVHEIDYNDGLRRARTLTTDLAPAHLTETGR
ncbi:hypothetical protein HCN51_04785 [Nonomuraea sp. FMUSA5-5]|uniref:ABC transporter n=1 Tax=Nonomuraea composti TaxID=2720023 RepID=A0ABX1B0T9_9ACTN|nr:hypothetical protein [Nonomuraea sp. FMUSA5-5]